jgi:hypothetical protein
MTITVGANKPTVGIFILPTWETVININTENRRYKTDQNLLTIAIQELIFDWG